MEKFEGSIETARPKGRRSGSLDVGFEHAAEQKPHQQKFESIGNDGARMLSCVILGNPLRRKH